MYRTACLTMHYILTERHHCPEPPPVSLQLALDLRGETTVDTLVSECDATIKHMYFLDDSWKSRTA